MQKISERKRIIKVTVLIIILFLTQLVLFNDMKFKKEKTDNEEKNKINMQDIAIQLGGLYNAEEIKEWEMPSNKKNNEQTLDDTNKLFQSKTLIINSNEEIKIEEAKNVIRYQDIYIAKYETEDLTQKYYEQFKNMNQVNYVEIDQIVSAETEIKAEETENLQKIETYQSKIQEVEMIQETEEEKIANMENKSALGKYIEENKNLGKDVKVAILDTGIDLKKEGIANRIIDVELNYSTSERKMDIMDDNGHGTQMASVILNNTDNQTKIMPIKVANSEGKATILSTYFGIITAIENDADIINISLSTVTNQKSELLQSAIKEATQKGIFVVVAAGNYGGETDYVTPANIEEAITVSAVTRDHKLADYSCYGTDVDFAAYGSDKEETINGTSYAAANVSAIIARLKSNMTPNILDVLKRYAIDIGEKGYDENFGNGLLTLEENEIEEKQENLETKIKLSDLDNWKNMNDEELNYYLSNINENYLAMFIQKLTKQELKAIIKKETILVTDYITYEETVDKKLIEKIKPYYEFLLEINLEELNTSANYFTRTTGYYTLYVIGGGKSKSTVKVNTTLAQIATGAKQTVSYSLSGTNNHGVKLTSSSNNTFPNSIYTYDPDLIPSTHGENDYQLNDNGQKVWPSKTYTVYGLELNYKKPSCTYATEGSKNIYDDTRLNFRTTNWANNKPSTVDNTLVNHYDTTEYIDMSVNAKNTNQLSGGGYGSIELLLEYPMLHITYDKNGGSVSGGSLDINTRETSLEYGTATKTLNNISSFGLYRTGYHIKDGAEWGTSPSGGTLFDEDREYTAREIYDFTDGTTVRNRYRTVYAQWEINSSTLVVNPNGGTWNGSGSTQRFTGDYNSTKSIPVPTRSGYTFAGWQRTNNYGTLSSTTSDATYRYGATDGVTDTITATWISNSSLQTVYVRYQNSDGSWGNYNTVINSYYNEGEYVSWSNSEDQTYESASIGYYVSGPKTSYIDVNRKKYNVTLTKGTGISSVTGAGSYYYGQQCRINAIVSTGYTWLNWTGSNTTTTQNYTLTVDGNKNYTANANINSSKLIVNPSGGTWNSSTASQSFTQNYNTTKNIANPIPPTGFNVKFNANGGDASVETITGIKRFSSWNKSSPFNGTLSGTTYTFGAGNGTTDTITANYINEAITLPTARRNGYNLKGWYTRTKWRN